MCMISHHLGLEEHTYGFMIQENEGMVNVGMSYDTWICCWKHQAMVASFGRNNYSKQRINDMSDGGEVMEVA